MHTRKRCSWGSKIFSTLKIFQTPLLTKPPSFVTSGSKNANLETLDHANEYRWKQEATQGCLGQGAWETSSRLSWMKRVLNFRGRSFQNEPQWLPFALPASNSGWSSQTTPSSWLLYFPPFLFWFGIKIGWLLTCFSKSRGLRIIFLSHDSFGPSSSPC